MCPNVYIGERLQCHPLIVKIEHPLDISYTCIAFDVYHPSSPSVTPQDSSFLNCKIVSRKRKDSNHFRREDFFISLVAPERSKCDTYNDFESKAVFLVSPPLRGWHGSPKAVQPYTIYDSSNPYCYVKATARREGRSDSDKYVFERTSNAKPSEHIGLMQSLRRYLIVTVSEGGDINVDFKKDLN